MGCNRSASSTVALGAACCMGFLGTSLLVVALMAGDGLPLRLPEDILTARRAGIALDPQEVQRLRADHARCTADTGALRREVARLQASQREVAAEIDELKLGFAELRTLVGQPATGSPARLGPPLPAGAGEESGQKHGGGNLSATHEALGIVAEHGAAGDPQASDQAAADVGAGRDGVAPRRRLGNNAFGLWRSGLKCLSSGEDDEKELGRKVSVDACHEACVKEAKLGNESCNFFLYGEEGKCRWEKDSACVSGEFEELKTYDIYKVNGFFLAEYWRVADERVYKHCNESLSGDGGDYRGCQDRTRSGLMCQRWASQRPQQHTRTPETYPDAGLVGNYCRNPDEETSLWCYTLDEHIRFEHCDPKSFFLEQAGVNMEDPQPHELFVAIEIALERNGPSSLWQDSHDAVLRHKLVGCLHKLDYGNYQRASVEAQYAFVGATTAWFGNLTELTHGNTSWDPKIHVQVDQHPLLVLLSRVMRAYQYGPEVPGLWLSNWKVLASGSDLRVRESAWTDVLVWAMELIGGQEIRAALVDMFVELPAEIVSKIQFAHLREWDGLMIARRWADASRHYNISGACDGHTLLQNVDYEQVFGMSPSDRRKVLEFRKGGKTLLLTAVSNCKCLCTCAGDAPQHEVCSRVIHDLASHYKDEEVAIDAMGGKTSYTAAMLAARSGAREVSMMLRDVELEQGYRRFQQETGASMPILRLACFSSLSTLLLFTVALALATACFKILQEDFRCSRLFDYNFAAFSRLLFLMGINITIKYAFEVLPLLCSEEANKLTKFALILETPWNVSPEEINTSILIIILVSLAGSTYDINLCHRSYSSAETIQPTDIYQDPGVAVSKCFLGMTGASCLFIIYLSYFTQPISMTLTGRFYWLLAVLVQAKLVIPEHGEGGSTLSQWVRGSTSDMRNPELWAVLLAGNDLQLAGGGKRIKAPARYEVYMRQLFSYVSNAVFRSVIIYTLPLYLAASTLMPLDFVLNACALTFIYEFDDLQDSRTYEVFNKGFPNDQSDSSDVSDSDKQDEALVEKS